MSPQKKYRSAVHQLWP